jgi:hypothetical protein
MVAVTMRKDQFAYLVSADSQTPQIMNKDSSPPSHIEKNVFRTYGDVERLAVTTFEALVGQDFIVVNIGYSYVHSHNPRRACGAS